jgi:hypothetical protein
MVFSSANFLTHHFSISVMVDYSVESIQGVIAPNTVHFLRLTIDYDFRPNSISRSTNIDVLVVHTNTLTAPAARAAHSAIDPTIAAKVMRHWSFVPGALAMRASNGNSKYSFTFFILASP